MKGQKTSEEILLSCFCFQGELCYPKKLERICLTRRPICSPEEGARLIHEHYLARSSWRRRIAPSKILFFKVERVAPYDWRSHRIWMYSSSGDFLGEDSGPRRFFGRAPESLRFHKGDFVLYWTKWYPLELQLGIVLGIPFSPERVATVNAGLVPVHLDETDDTYAVYSWDGDDFSHDHLPECYLFEPTGPIYGVHRIRLRDLLARSMATRVSPTMLSPQKEF